jgi:hypothetical protein
MIIRNDLKNSVTIPTALTETLLRIGGKNPYGEAMFRVIWAQDRITKAAGAWNVWPENASLDERGGLGIQTMQGMLVEAKKIIDTMETQGFAREDIKRMSDRLNQEIEHQWNSKMGQAPLRVDHGMQDVELYAVDGFVLEKWKPASAFGTRSEWESFRFEGQNALGPYPESGDYELIAGPTPYMPTSSQLEDAVRQHFNEINNRPASAKDRFALLLSKMDQKRAAKEREWKNLAESYAKDGPASLRNRLSLGAGRVMQGLADKAGLKGHYGS